jgi:hypothetical protein
MEVQVALQQAAPELSVRIGGDHVSSGRSLLPSADEKDPSMAAVSLNHNSTIPSTGQSSSLIRELIKA